MKIKKILYNVVSGFGGKIIIMVISFIVPRLMITGYGSEVNGLFTTLNNIYTYMALVEAGIGTSAVQMLYKPVVNKDKEEINNILYTTKKYFHKCGWLYLIGVIILASVLPIGISSTISSWRIVLIALLQGAASLLNFFIVAGVTVLLTAEGKQYVTNNVVLLSGLLTNIAKIILVNAQVDIVLLQTAYFFVSLLVTCIYYFYFKRHYPWVNRKQGDDTLRLPQRKAFMLHTFAGLVFNNTDTIIISVFCGLKSASVYAIYNMVFVNLGSLINSVSSGFKFLLGQKYNENREEYILLHDTYKSFYCGTVFAIFTVAYILILPFVSLYTHGVSDVEYIDQYLPILFSMVHLLSACRMTETNLVEMSFHAEQTISRAMVETGINLVVSLIAVNFLGIYGCLLGTIVALLYRTNDFIIYANWKILNRLPKQAYLTMISNFLVFFAVVVCVKYTSLKISNYFDLVLWGAILTFSFMLIYGGINALTNIKGFRYLIGKLLRKGNAYGE